MSTADAIANLIINQGNIRADALNRAAEAQARAQVATAQAQAQAQQNTGQIWGQTLQSLGQLPMQVVGQIQQQKNEALLNQQRQQALQMGAMQLDQAQRVQQGQKALAGMLQDSQPPGPNDVGPQQENYLDDQGLFDIPKLSKRLGVIGYGDLAPTLLKGAEDLNDSVVKHQELQQKLTDQQTIMVGQMAAGVKQMLGLGVPIDRAMDFVVQPALARKQITPAAYAQVKQQLLSLSPENADAGLTALMDQAAKVGPTTKVGPDESVYDMFGRLKMATAGKPQVVGGNLVATGPPATPGGPPTATAIFTAQKPDYTIGNQRFSGAGVPIGQPVEMPGKTPEEQYLAAKAAGDQTKAGLILQGMREVATAKRDPDALAVANELARLRVDEAQARLEALQNAPDKTQQARLDRSYTNSVAQLNTLRKPVETQLDNIGTLTTSLNQMTPQADALIAPELLKTVVGGQGSGVRMTDTEMSRIAGGRSAWEDLKAKLQHWSLDPSQALQLTDAQRQQMRAMVTAVQQKAQTKLTILNKAANDLIDAPDVDTHRRVLQGAREALTDVATGTGAGGGNGKIAVPAPDGHTYYFNSQADADTFKTKAGIK